MNSAIQKGLYVLLLIVLTATLVGCNELAKLIDGTSNTPQQPVQTAIATQHDAKLPEDVPTDIRILDGAKAIEALKTGDGITKGDGFYQISFRVATSVEETATLYRKLLADQQYDFIDEPVAGSVSISGSTPSWLFYLTIFKSTEVKGETSVTISYTK